MKLFHMLEKNLWSSFLSIWKDSIRKYVFEIRSTKMKASS
ncbi:hypothetical protein HMPREF9013_1284 [Bulleidia extructa W1219]|uniref:Uncharacterized protein n=1 Tax=Bulleidia extructa W1219 TaxID=679192 RepID=D2MPG9_9FIRM|nr:hypothetical protein HMPREF9013_1284 [Bulleidia extructa W1219]